MIEKSESVAKLAAALAVAQGKFPAAKFDATNAFLKNKYASLGSIIEAAKPILAENGLSVSQLMIGGGDHIGVSTVLLHSSGEWIESTVVMPINDEKGKSAAQAAGSVVTYLRRYALASILGIYADDDTDGQQASGNKKAEQPAVKKAPEPDNGKPADPNKRPYAPEVIKAKIEAAAKQFKPFNPTEKQFNLLRYGLELCFVGEEDIEDKRHTVLTYLSADPSTKNVSGQMFKALVEKWLELKPADDGSGEYTVNPDAVKEAHAIVAAALIAQMEL